MKKHGICLLPDARYLSELNVPGKPNRTNLWKMCCNISINAARALFRLMF